MQILSAAIKGVGAAAIMEVDAAAGAPGVGSRGRPRERWLPQGGGKIQPFKKAVSEQRRGKPASEHI